VGIFGGSIGAYTNVASIIDRARRLAIARNVGPQQFDQVTTTMSRIGRRIRDGGDDSIRPLG